MSSYRLSSQNPHQKIIKWGVRNLQYQDIVIKANISLDGCNLVAEICLNDARVGFDGIIYRKSIIKNGLDELSSIKPINFYYDPVECEKILQGFNQYWTEKSSQIIKVMLQTQEDQLMVALQWEENMALQEYNRHKANLNKLISERLVKVNAESYN